MRRPARLLSSILVTPILAIIAVLGPLAAPRAALAATLSVNIDQAERVTISHAVKDVIVGNPMIADVAVLDPHHLLITGKGYGVTNILITDTNGRAVMSRSLVVGASNQGRVSVYRGPDVYNYACNARCERTPMPGERADGVYAPYSAPYNEYSSRTHNAEQSSGQNAAP
ncbi:MAG TPA: pilus assembly protein N-terminal domain-containing protein [Caulobacteraceae bacterium]